MVLESVASVIRNENGEPEKLVIVNRDITERKKVQEALVRSEASFRSLWRERLTASTGDDHGSVPASESSTPENARL